MGDIKPKLGFLSDLAGLRVHGRLPRNKVLLQKKKKTYTARTIDKSKIRRQWARGFDQIPHNGLGRVILYTSPAVKGREREREYIQGKVTGCGERGVKSHPTSSLSANVDRLLWQPHCIATPRNRKYSRFLYIRLDRTSETIL